MSTGEIASTGYNEEERYFHEREAELLKKKREELNAVRKAREEQAEQHIHWMKCPKCGHDMEEVSMDNVMVDRCPSCQGVYFDRGELELLIGDRKEEGGGFLKAIQGVLLPRKK